MSFLPDEHESRRKWVKRFVLGTAASLCTPRWSATLLAEELPSSAILRLHAADYPALAAPGGSVQLVFKDVSPPFTLNRVSADRFVALDSICTHLGCTVAAAVNNRMRCPCHFSRYDLEGRVYRNANGESTEPAKFDLNRFDTTYDPAAGVVSIHIPGLALGISSLAIQQQSPGGNLRLKLRFPVSASSTYEIRYQPSIQEEFNVVAFATTPGGPANQTSIRPLANGFTTAYVDSTGPRGFYVVALKLDPYVP